MNASEFLESAFVTSMNWQSTFKIKRAINKDFNKIFLGKFNKWKWNLINPDVDLNSH